MAISWRGTGGTFAGADVKKVKLLDHVGDLRCLLTEALPEFLEQSTLSVENPNPVLISHSFGGLAVMKYLEMYSDDPIIRGVVTLCSVPPSGNGKITLRYLRRSPIAGWRITAGFALKKCLTNGELCRTLFFGGPKVSGEGDEIMDRGISDEDLTKYQGYFARDSAATIDIMDLPRHLPSKVTDSNGRACFRAKLDQLPCLVAGAIDDYIVDREALDETATYFGLAKTDVMPLLIDSPHDVMLGAKWNNAAEKLNGWLDNIFHATTS